MNNAEESEQKEKGADFKSRRQHTRVHCHWSGTMQTMSREVVPISVKNVSLGGVGITSGIQVPKGTKVFLEFLGINAQKSCRIRVICVVAFVVLKAGKYEMGLQFTSSVDAFRPFLIDYVNAKTVG